MAQLQHAEGGRPLAKAEVIRTRRTLSRRIVSPLLRHALLALVALVFVGPMYWMLISGLKSMDEIFASPIVWWPRTLRWSNIGDVLNYPGFPFLRYLWNSTFYAGSVTIGTVISCAATGYGFARLRFPGRDLLFGIAISTLMIPWIVTFIPTYVLFKYLHMIGSYAPLIIPSFLGGNGLYIFMLRQFFLGVPWELSEAAKVDGASEWRIFWQIMLPLVRSVLIVVAVFSFVWTWQNFFGPLVYLSDQNQYPLTLGLFAFRAQRTTDWPLLMAAASLTTVPLMVLFFAAQRY
jgi:multiple sugar transport system permease protein